MFVVDPKINPPILEGMRLDFGTKLYCNRITLFSLVNEAVIFYGPRNLRDLFGLDFLDISLLSFACILSKSMTARLSGEGSRQLMIAVIISVSQGAIFISLDVARLPGLHDDVIKWKHFPRYWPFVRGIHRSSVNSRHKTQWRGVLMFSFDLCHE